MAIEHDAIVSSETHEPRGVATATVNEVYVATGAGSGAYKPLEVTVLGIASGTAGETVRVNAGATALEFVAETGTIHGYLGLANNSTTLAITAAGDATLNTDSQYIKLTNGTSDLWTTFTEEGVTIINDYIQIDTAGDYEINFWVSASSDVINSLISVKFSTDDTNASLSAQKVKRDHGATDTFGVGAASGIFTSFSSGDKISIWVASDKTISYLAEDVGVSVKLLKVT